MEIRLCYHEGIEIPFARLMIPTLEEIDQITKNLLTPRTPEGWLMEYYSTSRLNRSEYHHPGGYLHGEWIPKTSLPMWDYDLSQVPEFYDPIRFLMEGPKAHKQRR
jgi:hypothetical protein